MKFGLASLHILNILWPWETTSDTYE